MEQPCYKCGQTVEQGTAFCPNCSAPQIRVVIAEPPPPVADSSAPSHVTDDLSPSTSIPTPALPPRWAQIVRPCAVAALIASILMSLGLYPLVALFSVGFLAVLFYCQRRPGLPLKTLPAAGLGALSGILCSVMTAFWIGLAASFPDFRTKLREQLLDNAQKLAASHPADPQIQLLLAQMKTPEGLLMVIIAASILFFILAVLLASLGGALGGTILGRTDKT
jgi:hypothetical protein